MARPVAHPIEVESMAFPRLAAISLESQGKDEDAAFYRGIARKLAEAHGKSRESGLGTRE